MATRPPAVQRYGRRLRISEVAQAYRVHPQTLREYERAGLLSPDRSRGNTRRYRPEDLQRLEEILELTRDRCVNLAGVSIILRLRDRLHTLERADAPAVLYSAPRARD